MADATICPYCNAKLRIAAAKRGTRNRVKCSVCKNRFHPSQILDHGESSRLNAPLFPAQEPAVPEAPQPAPEAAPLPATPPTPRVPLPAASYEPPELGLDPYVQESAYPAALVDRRSERRSERRRERPKGESTRVRSSRHGSDRKQVKTTLVALLLLCGTAIAAFALWSYLKETVFATGPGSQTLPTVSPTSLGGDAPKSNPLLPRDTQPQSASRMVGIWDYRTDDESRGWYEFRKDGSLSMFAWRGDQETRPLHSNWFVLTDENETILLEVGEEQGAFGNMRLYMTMTSPDAFTLTRVDDKGILNIEAKRFARRGPTQP